MFTVGPARALKKKPLIEAITDLGLTTGLKLCLDAGDINSYPGTGQKWLDLSGGGYDFFLGADGTASAADPAFNGEAGGLSADEYFSFDGGDYFTYDTTPEAWMNAIHKNNAIWGSFAIVYRPDGGAIYPNGNTDANNETGFRHGLLTNGRVQVAIQNSGGGGPGPLNVLTDSGPAGDAWVAVGCSVDEAGGDVSFCWINGNYEQVSAANTFDAAYASPSSGNATYILQIGALGNGQAPATTGALLSMVAMWEGAAPTKPNFDDLLTLVNRFGI